MPGHGHLAACAAIVPALVEGQLNRSISSVRLSILASGWMPSSEACMAVEPYGAHPCGSAAVSPK